MTTLSSIQAAPSITFSGAGLPSVSTIGAVLDDVYLNTTTGESFRCHDATFGAQIWQGDKGNVAGADVRAFNHPNLVAAYTMDNISGSTLIDESPNSNNGTITGAVAVAGHIDNALNFDAPTELVDCGDIAAADFTTALTVVAWVKTSDATKNKIVVDKRASTYGWFLSVQTSGVVAAIVYGETAAVLDNVLSLSTTTVNDGVYHLIIGEWDYSGNVAISIDDGALEDPTAMSGLDANSWHSVGEVTIGNKSPSYVGPSTVTDMIGDIDQVRIFNRVLTSAEKTALYNSGVGA